MEIILHPVATVHNSRKTTEDDNWASVISEIIVADNIPDKALSNIDLFSHLEIIYYFNQEPSEEISFSRHPRGNASHPEMGIFAQRNKDRPNRIGLCTVALLACNGRTLTVKNLDAIDGTPVLDIKPVFTGFQPKGEIKQPEWVNDLMKNYW